jgi:transposase
VIRARAALVEARTKLVNPARGLMKASGKRLPQCAAQSVKPTLLRDPNDALAVALKPLLAAAAALTLQIRGCDRQIAGIAKLYPEVARLDQVTGVGLGDHLQSGQR